MGKTVALLSEAVFDAIPRNSILQNKLPLIVQLLKEPSHSFVREQVIGLNSYFKNVLAIGEEKSKVYSFTSTENMNIEPFQCPSFQF